MGVKFREGLN